MKGNDRNQLVNAAAAYSDAQTNGMVMMSNQDPDEYRTKVIQEGGELEHIGESFTKARISYLILEGLSDAYEPARLAVG